jgi:hypothetical protein
MNNHQRRKRRELFHKIGDIMFVGVPTVIGIIVFSAVAFYNLTH